MEQIYRVIDGSWAFTIGENGLESISGIDMQRQQYRILAENCVLPTRVSNGCYRPSKKNDCIIVDINDGAVVFIRREFLAKINRCPHCGKVIE